MPVTYENQDKTLVKEGMMIYSLERCKDNQVENINMVEPDIPVSWCLFTNYLDIIEQQKSCPDIGKIYSFIETEKITGKS